MSNHLEFKKGTRVVFATFTTAERWHWTLFVNNGESATRTNGKAKTLKGLEKAAERVLNK